MNLLIVNNSYSPCNYSELQYYGTIQYINSTDLSQVDLNELLHNKTAVLLTGGPQHIPYIEEYPELAYELQLIDIIVKRNIKLIGICLGFQLINYYFGNTIVKLKSPCIGYNFLDPTTFTTHGDSRLDAIDVALFANSLSFHYDGVMVNKNPDIQVVAQSIPIGESEGMVYAIKHAKYPIYAVQSHPDANVARVMRCMKRFIVEDIVLREEDYYTKIFHNFFSPLLL